MHLPGERIPEEGIWASRLPSQRHSSWEHGGWYFCQRGWEQRRLYILQRVHIQTWWTLKPRISLTHSSTVGDHIDKVFNRSCNDGCHTILFQAFFFEPTSLFSVYFFNYISFPQLFLFCVCTFRGAWKIIKHQISLFWEIYINTFFYLNRMHFCIKPD